MTKLEQLIEELCPNGVEYHELGKIAEMQRGTSITKKECVRVRFLSFPGTRTRLLLRYVQQGG